MSVGSGATPGVFKAKRVGGHAVHSIRFSTLDELWKAQLLLPTSITAVVTPGGGG
jgi:hypothetical protein